MHRRGRRRRRRLAVRRARGARGGRIAQMKVACIGMGWWSDVLANAIQRSGKLTLAGCYTRSVGKRQKFAAKYGCRAARSYDAILAARSIEANINATPK